LNAWRHNRPTLADLSIDDDKVRGRRRDLMLDFGAIAKGFAVDRAIAILRAQGIENALINAGGNLRGLGHKMQVEGRPWRIAIRNPRGNEPLAWIELQDGEGVSTSGDYERFAVVENQRIHHLLDPASGSPVAHTIAVTVIARDATTADAASTAIFVAGPSRWRAIARAFAVQEVLRVDADGKIELTRALAARTQMPSSEPRPTSWRVVDL
jgi:thiamine biosynthesis lipoprotein